MKNEQDNQQPSNEMGQVSTDNTVSAVIEKALALINDKSTLPPRPYLRLPVSYEQFHTLVKAQAERIMSKQGNDNEYIIDKNVEAVMRKLYAFTQNPTRKGIALVGKFGCGKTLLMQAYIEAHNVFASLCQSKGIAQYEGATAPFLFEYINNKGRGGRYSLFTYVPMFIDEFGREPQVGKNFGNETTPVIDLIFDRWSRGAVTHITSNWNSETLSGNGFYGQKMGSRMKDMFEFVVMVGDDRRGKGVVENRRIQSGVRASNPSDNRECYGDPRDILWPETLDDKDDTYADYSHVL